MALSYAVRDRLMTRHLAYKDALRDQQPKAVAYLSDEFLIGPQLGNNLLMLGIQQQAAAALKHFGISANEEILAEEEEPGLGNGGLGRLAADHAGDRPVRGGLPTGVDALRRHRHAGAGRDARDDLLVQEPRAHR
jgi:glucan phosphorylase